MDFVKSEDTRVFILKGYAGTGKTTLMSGLIKWMDERAKELDQAAEEDHEQEAPYRLLASTGRAAKILSDKSKSAANTIHSHIYSFKDINSNLEELPSEEVNDKGQISLVFELRPIKSGTTITYIVDESSMISDQQEKKDSFAQFGSGDLLLDLITYDANGKFIFIGDPCQLPPVGQADSPALNSDHIRKKYNVKVDEYELTEIIRQQNGNGIIDASFKLRNLHASNPPVKFARMPVKGRPNIQLHNSEASLLAEYLKSLKEHGYRNHTLICQTNLLCSQHNAFIRSHMHNKAENLVPGDLLMITQNNHLSGLANGDQVIVTHVGSQERHCNLSFINVEVEGLFSKKRSTQLLIENVLISKATNLDSRQYNELMIDFFFRMKQEGIRQKSKEFKEKMLTDKYLNALRAVYGYALTCHKSQGGDWDEVFLFLNNKIHGIPKPEIYQWWYTAVTRARKTLHVINDWFIE
jgi:ATP-dependent exoDNAse (exonuclease V) alpha subunit